MLLQLCQILRRIDVHGRRFKVDLFHSKTLVVQQLPSTRVAMQYCQVAEASAREQNGRPCCAAKCRCDNLVIGAAPGIVQRLHMRGGNQHLVGEQDDDRSGLVLN